ncbi:MULTISPECIES: extensin family protein [Rhodococcus]|uniref:extensin family protein n=1 Tax=Rhodococcus TaxID=1827 RepID=UPI001D144095|nr:MULTISPECIES: extensin family protein [Rhodococcus]MCD2140911.1 extensin family protein [Rhodococcus pyridinivorans]UTM39989.1 extensin family protein [Rhodococcus pyridinivorans]
MKLTRRQLLTVLTAGSAAAVASCTLEPAPPQPAPSATTPRPQPPDLSRPDRAARRSPLSAAASRWQPAPGEVFPEIKRTAAAFLETAGNWSDGGTAVGNLVRAGASAISAATASVLHPSTARAGELTVIYPQYGGLAPDTAAVIALVEQNLRTVSGPWTRELVVDVRLARRPGGSWTVERLVAPTSLGPPLPLTDTAAAVLAEPRIILSGPAQNDVSTGRIDNRLLAILHALSREFTVAIQVMHTGHVQTVYPTARVSNHAVGRAVDIREIDGRPVVDTRPGDERVLRLMRRAAELGATEVGGPVDLNGPRKGFFSDDVHHDHIHLGVTPGDPPAHLR